MSSLFSTGMLLLPLLTALIVSTVLTRYLSRPWARLRILDHPNERSLHCTPVSRTGGLAILAGIGGGLLIIAGFGLFPLQLFGPLTGASLVALVSLYDDRNGVGALPRFAVHGLAASIAMASGLVLPALEIGGWSWAWPGTVGIVFTLLFLVWMTNLYNFMDGMDGFAGGMGLIGFGFLGFFGWLNGDWGYALTCWCIAMACLGFLCFNFPPARIFMGDTGASTLGFLAAVLILWGDIRGLFPLWAGVLVFSPFIVDATATLSRRILAGEKFWQAHRRHFYQRLVQLGWGHRKTVLVEYVVMLAAGGCAWFFLRIGATPWQLIGLAACAALYALAALIINFAEQRAQIRGRSHNQDSS